MDKDYLNDLVGRRFGRLEVLEATEKRANECIVWKCLCDCGNVREISGKSLRRGFTRSCGCLRKEISAKNLFGRTKQ